MRAQNAEQMREAVLSAKEKGRLCCMRHHIIVKFNELAGDKAALTEELRALFAPCTQIEGVHGCTLIENCVSRANRYDLMIVLDMEAEALPRWDESALHRTWKERYGRLVEKKAIFDCE